MATRASLGSLDDGLTATAYALAATADEMRNVALKVKSGLEDGSVKLSYVVLSMQDLVFDHSDPDKKSEDAMAYLVAILKELKKDVLSRADISLLTQFLQANVKNDPSRFKQSCQALQSLSAMTRFTSKSATDMVSDIYNNSGETFSSQPVTARFEAYKLLNQLLNSHRKIIRGMGTDFVRIVVNLATTERDPRNLMLVFTMTEVVLNEWEPEHIDEMSDELYETLQRYFPISFRPKPNDPLTITAEDLIMKLRGCFASYSGFAPSLFPDLIQRLDDPNRLNAKADVLETMIACISRYEPAVAAKWSSKLWDALKYEIFNSSDDSQAPAALKVMTTLSSRLSFGHNLQTLEGSPLQKYLTVVTTGSLTRIREEGLKSSRSAGQILAAVASGSPFAYHMVVREAVPVLLSISNKDDENISNKRAALEVMNQLLDARIIIGKVEQDWEFVPLSELEAESVQADSAVASGEQKVISNGGMPYYRDELTSAYMSVARNPIPGEKQYRNSAIQGLSKLMHLQNFLEESDVDSYMQYFALLVVEIPDMGDEVRQEAIKALRESLVLYPSRTWTSVYPIFSRALEFLQEQGEERKDAHLALLAALGDVFAKSSEMAVLVLRLQEWAVRLIGQYGGTLFAKNFLVGILYALTQREKHKGTTSFTDSEEGGLRKSADNLLHMSMSLKPFDEKPYVALNDVLVCEASVSGGLLELVGKVVMVILRSLKNLDLWLLEAPLVYHAQPDVSLVKDDPEQREKWLATQQRQFDLTTSATAPLKVNALVLGKYILTGLPRKTKPELDGDNAAQNLIDFLLTYNASPVLRSHLLDLLALLVNKYTYLLSSTNPDVATNLVHKLLYTIAIEPPINIKNRVQILATVTQAANLAGNKQTTPLLQALLASLSLPRLAGRCVAQSFGAILAPSPTLTKENGCIVRAISKQKLFSTCVPVIVEDFAAANDQEIKSNYLVALGGILRNVPGDMILPHIDVLLPLLLRSIEGGNEQAKGASIDVVRIAAIESPAAIEGHVSGIIKRLLSCLEKERDCGADTRTKAVEALGVLPKTLRLQIVLPFKKSVVKALRGSSEDPSRRVREAVVNCQMVWWKLASEEDED